MENLGNAAASQSDVMRLLDACLLSGALMLLIGTFVLALRPRRPLQGASLSLSRATGLVAKILCACGLVLLVVGLVGRGLRNS